MSKVKRLKEKILTALFPQRCPFCRKVIAACDLYCGSCAKNLPKTVYTRFALGGFPCCSPLPYIGEYARAIKAFKFGRQITYAKPLMTLAVSALKKTYDISGFDGVTYVPMYKKKEYDHAKILAKEAAEQTGLPLIDALEKHRKNKPQHKLNRKERIKNITGVFRLSGKDSVKGKRIILVDDIMTTGSTLGECARILKKGGCKEIVCVTVCKTLR